MPASNHRFSQGIDTVGSVIQRLAPILLFVLMACDPRPGTAEQNTDSGSRVYQIADLTLTATANDTHRNRPRPTVTSRYLALVFTAVYDAWSRYDNTAIPVFLEADRRPASENTRGNKEIATSYAAYCMLMEFFPADSVLFRNWMAGYHLDVSNLVFNVESPMGIGCLAAKEVLEARVHDGSNEYGDEEGSDGKPYFDYTGYKPANPVDTLKISGRWQPKYFVRDDGTQWAPSCLTPYWYLVRPIALGSASHYRPQPPPAIGSEALHNEVAEVVRMQAEITPEQKALVEFMRDGPHSVQQAGHWLRFAMNVSARDHQSIDDDVCLFFVTEVAAMDAFIACWDAKMFYDFARPYALVHEQFSNDSVFGWKGEGKGWGKIRGEDWRPYSPSSFLCPPFPSYPSGHSTVSGACSEVLRLFTGNDSFGESVTLVPGALTEPENVSDTVTLYMPTFTQTADMAGISRVLGGYHIPSDNSAGLALGRNVGNEVWQFYAKHRFGEMAPH